MDLSRLTNDKKLRLCQWYFKVGCVFLPFVWAVNAIWFFKEAFVKPPYEEQREIRKYVLMSAIGSFVWAVGLSAWVVIFQVKRVSWDSAGDAISFLVPLGKP